MIIFLHGDDTYRSRAKLRELKEKFLREVDPSGANLAVIDGATAEASVVWGAIAAQSFLVRKRMVVVEDIGAQKSKTAREEIAAFLDRVSEDVIVVFWESKSRQPQADSHKQSVKRSVPKKPRRGGVSSLPAKSDALFDRLLVEKYAQEFAPLTGTELATWIRERAKMLGVTIEPKAQQMLIQEAGSDLWRMSNEIEKLAVAARANVITPNLVGALVSETPSDNIFAFIDAVANGDRSTAFQQLRALEVSGAEPQIIASMLARQFRLRLAAADLIARGTPIAEIASELGVKPFVAQKLIQQVRDADLDVLRAQFLRLVDLDRELKSSRASWQVLIELFCLDVTIAR